MTTGAPLPARSPDTTGRRLLGAAVSTSGMTALYTALLLVTTIGLARWLGPTQYGVYALVLSVVAIAGSLATPGTENLLVRDVAAYGSRSQHGRSRGLYHLATVVALGTSLLLALAIPTITWFSRGRAVDDELLAVTLGCVIILVAALSRVRAATLTGLHHVVLARVPELVVRPVVLLALLALAVVVGWGATASSAVALTCVAYGASFVVGSLFLRSRMPEVVRVSTREYDWARWLRSSPSFFVLGFSDVLNTQLSITLVGWLDSARSAGVFAVANRGAAIVALGFVGAAAVAAPRIARLWTQGDLAALDSLLRRATLFGGGVAAVGVATYAAFGGPLLRVFGEGFADGSTALLLLSLGQLAYAVVGIRATALLMTGGERQAAAVLGVSLASTTLLSLLLIPRHGMDGAAAAWAASMVVTQALTIILWRRHRAAARPLQEDTCAA